MKSTRILFFLLIAIIGGTLPFLCHKSDFLHNLEMKTIDFRMLLQEEEKNLSNSKTVVILIDDAALKQYPYRSPVPRDMLAKMIAILDRSGAELIGLDILLKDFTWEREDALLRSAMIKSGRVVLVNAMRTDDNKTVLDQANDYFLEAALGSGLSDMPIDPTDQVVRTMKPYYQIQENSTPTLSTLLALLQTKASSPKLVIEDKHLVNEEYVIKMTEPPSSVSAEGKNIPIYSASALLTGFLPEEWFRDKIILIGAGYEDNTDSYRTPYYVGKYGWPLTPGVEIHASALETLLNKNFVSFPNSTTVFFLAFGLCLALLFFEGVTNSLFAGFFSLLLLTGYGFFAAYRFEAENEALPFASISIALLFSYGAAVIYRGLTEGRQKRWIQNAFGMYISPDLVKILVNSPDSMKLGGEEKEVTVLFSDLQGFTTISEGLSPTELVSLLNEYLDGMTNIVLKHRGTLDKYEGDAIMAFWGAPLADSAHALHAIQAALEMQEFSEVLSKRFQAEGKPSLITRIGINTGKAVVGNIGSKKRFDYTLIGDEVNLASRLEGANKAYGTTLMIGEQTWSRVQEEVISRELDLIRVKGKQVPVKVFEVISLKEEKKDDMLFLPSYTKALQEYRLMKWQEAEKCFLEVLEIKNDDGPSKTYLERCRNYQKVPPHENWDGVYVMQTK